MIVLCCRLFDGILYPLAEQLEREQAAKVTAMLLKMDQTEVLHLLELPDTLKAMFAEAMEVLRSAQHLQQSNASHEQQLVMLSLNDGVVSLNDGVVSS
jgi:polyadenylate-binding protein